MYRRSSCLNKVNAKLHARVRRKIERASSNSNNKSENRPQLLRHTGTGTILFNATLVSDSENAKRYTIKKQKLTDIRHTYCVISPRPEFQRIF